MGIVEFSKIQNELDKRDILTDIKYENGKHHVIINFEIVASFKNEEDAKNHIVNIHKHLE
jgi:HD superfamily phosphodiesterase